MAPGDPLSGTLSAVVLQGDPLPKLSQDGGREDGRALGGAEGERGPFLLRGPGPPGKAVEVTRVATLRKGVAVP